MERWIEQWSKRKRKKRWKKKKRKNRSRRRRRGGSEGCNKYIRNVNIYV